MTNGMADMKADFITDLRRLLSCIPRRRKWQLGILFILQLASALSEALSLGTIIPFLSALTNVSAVMENHYILIFREWTGIDDAGHLVMALAGLFAASIVLANILRFCTLWLQLRLLAVIGTDLSVQLFSKTLHQPYNYFLTGNSSDLIGNTTNDLRAAIGILQGLFTLVTQALIAIAVIGGLLVYNPKVALSLVLIIGATYTVLMLLIRHRLNTNSLIISDSYRHMIKALQEGYGGIRDIALHRTHKTFLDQYEKVDRPHRYYNAINNIIREAPRFVIDALGVIAICSVAILYVLRGNEISLVIPLLGFLALAAHRLLPAVQQIYAAVGSLFALRVSLHRSVDMLTRPVCRNFLLPNAVPLPLTDTLSFDHVWFRYNDTDKDDRWTLEDLSFQIKAKSTIAFVGYTGSGKSTIADLILGLITPQKGQITIDGTPLTADNIAAWQSKIAHVPQHIFLTDATIAENIAFGVPYDQIDHARLKDAARNARIHDFIESLPRGYDEMAGERGVRISGGQLQRIGIARALYNNPSLIIFDEATSALDSNTEKEVMAAIEGLSHDLTIILIAHRISTVQQADNILLLDHGRLLAQGNYAQLSADSDHFKTLIRHIGQAA